MDRYIKYVKSVKSKFKEIQTSGLVVRFFLAAQFFNGTDLDLN